MAVSLTSILLSMPTGRTNPSAGPVATSRSALPLGRVVGDSKVVLWLANREFS